LSELLEGSFSKGSDYSEWEAKRKFIVTAIDVDGSLLDVGCANGFLLMSLKAWSQHNLECYGIDIREDLVEDARALFPGQEGNFSASDVRDFAQFGIDSFPKSFDYIFWNFLGSWDISEDVWSTTFHRLLAKTRRRLIVGLYGSNDWVKNSLRWRSERENLILRLDSFRKSGIEFTGYELNANGFNNIIAWIDIR
jgi:hypothetical protein